MENLRLKMNSEEVFNFINHVINNNKDVVAAGRKPLAVEVISSPGLGKTELGEQIAKHNDMKFVKFNLSQISDNGDLMGSPIRQILMVKGDVKEWVAINSTKQYADRGFEEVIGIEPRTTYCKPEWVANEDRPILLLLDDWTRAQPDFLQAAMELIECQTFSSWKLPKGSFVMLTSNPSGGDMQVNEIDDAMRTRFASIELKWSKETWAAWAERVKLDGRCINFVLHENDSIFNPKSQHASIVNARTLTKFFDSIYSIKGDYSKKENNILVSICGNTIVGPEVTNLFMAFIKNKLDRIPQPEDIYNKKEDEIFKALEDVCNDGANYQNHIATMLCERVINYTKRRIDEKGWKPDDVKRLIALCNNRRIFKEDAAFHIVRSLVSDSKYEQKCMAMFRDPVLSRALIS